jgi:hypothetical protein
MSGCPLAINSRPQPVVGWLLREKIDTCHLRATHPLTTLWEPKWGKTQPEPKWLSITEEIDLCDSTLVTFEDCHSSRWLGVMFWAPKSNCGVPVNKSVKVLEVYLEDLPRVIGRGIGWGLSVLRGKTQPPQPDVQLIQQLELVYQIVVSSSTLPGFKFTTPYLYAIPLLKNL